MPMIVKRGKSTSVTSNKRRTTGIGRDLGSLAGYMIPGGGVLTSALGGSIGDYAEKKMTNTSSKQAFSNESTLSTRHAASRKKGAKLGKRNAKKTVKVSSALRAKIGKVIEEKKVHGSWTQISFGYVQRPADCSQQVQAIQQIGTNQDFGGGWQFLPEQLLHCASVLFNGKADSQSNRVLDSVNNLGMDPATDGQIAGVQNSVTPEKGYLGCNAKFHVLNSYEKYHMKNNTQQTLKVRAYTCSIKNTQSAVATTVIDPLGQTTTNQVTMEQTPTVGWINTLGTKTGKNIAAADIYRIGMRPESDPLWKKIWNYEVTEIILDPGQSHSINVQGPKGVDINFQRFYKEKQFMSIQKFSRYTFFLVESDLIQGSTTDFGLVGRFKLAGTGCLLLERKMHISLTVPESTGARVNVIIPTTSTNYQSNIEMGYRSARFAHYVYAPATPTALQRIDEQQPANVEG